MSVYLSSKPRIEVAKYLVRAGLPRAAPLSEGRPLFQGISRPFPSATHVLMHDTLFLGPSTNMHLTPRFLLPIIGR